VSCDLARTVLHGYLDGELDAVRAAEFERHLERCSECVAQLEAQESLRSFIKRAELYEKAPGSFRAKILSQIPAESGVRVIPRRTSWTWLVAAAAVLLLAYTSWRILPGLRGNNDEMVFVAQVVDAHLRSLQPGHLTDIISTDQHTVKPWFDGRLDFAPPVRDFVEQGFPLQGGRLDILGGRTVAALVYGRRKHFVNVFIWPASATSSAPRSGSRLGYQWIDWRQGGMEFCAVSDISLADLHQFQQLLSAN
jgi:mycothiol system anti-sigma-R factor